MSYWREDHTGGTIDRIICDPCGAARFPTDEDRYASTERWVWAPWPVGRPCDDCGAS